MTTNATHAPAKKSGYNPYAIRRRVRHTLITNEGVAVGVTKSFTKDDGTEYHPIVCLTTRRVDCQCGHFNYRKAKHAPTLDTPAHWCKHIVREVGNLMRRGILEPYTLRVVTEASELDEAGFDTSKVTSPVEVPPYVDPITGAVRDGWYQLEAGIWGLPKGEWVNDEIVAEARAKVAALILPKDDGRNRYGRFFGGPR
jgi:hypothetical protein